MIKKFNDYSFFLKIYNYNTINFCLNFNKNLFKFYLCYIILCISFFYFSLCCDFFNPTCLMISSSESSLSEHSSDSDSSSDELNDFEYIEFNLNQSNYLSISTSLKSKQLTFIDIMDINNSTNELLIQFEDDMNKFIKKITFEIDLSKHFKQPLDIQKVVKILQSENCIEFINNNFLSEAFNNSSNPNEQFVVCQRGFDFISIIVNELSTYQDDTLDDKLENYYSINNTLYQKSNQLLLSNNLKYFEPFFDHRSVPYGFDENFQIIKKYH